MGHGPATRVPPLLPHPPSGAPRAWRSGDVVLAHQKLPHSVGLNRSPHIRYQVYFRLSSREYKPAKAAERGLWDNWRVGAE